MKLDLSPAAFWVWFDTTMNEQCADAHIETGDERVTVEGIPDRLDWPDNPTDDVLVPVNVLLFFAERFPRPDLIADDPEHMDLTGHQWWSMGWSGCCVTLTFVMRAWMEWLRLQRLASR